MADFEKVVRGYVTRLYPGPLNFFFHVSGDREPYGFAESDYNFIPYTDPKFQPTYELLLKAAEQKWKVVVVRSASMEKHRKISEKWTQFYIDYVYVDF